MMNIDQFVADYIRRWEGGMSRHPNDAGNWSTGQKGVGVLLGSNYGVTGRTLAAYRGVRVETLKMWQQLLVQAELRPRNWLPDGNVEHQHDGAAAEVFERDARVWAIVQRERGRRRTRR